METVRFGISIHALREEGDVHAYDHAPTTFEFLSTPSARRATGRPWMTAAKHRPFLSTPSARRATPGESYRP